MSDRICQTCNDCGLRPLHAGANPPLIPCECSKIKPECRDDHVRYNGPVHTWFSLSYAAYFTVPRLALQGMPLWWQRLFLWLVNMLPPTPEYACQRRDENGRFIKDDWANYRRGSIDKLLGRK